MKLVSVETPEKNVCKMTFSASAAELEEAAEAVYERTRDTFTIKGFAKGQADRAQIEADRGEHVFWYDAINDLMDRDVPGLYEKALADQDLTPVDEPSYDLVSVKKEDGFVATATVALQPTLELGKTQGFEVSCTIPATTDKEVERVIERRRAGFAELVPHKGPAVKGNIVHMDYTGYVNGEPFPGGSATKQAIELGRGRMIPGFEEGIIGHQAGDEFDLNVTFPANYHAKDLAGKEAVFKIKVIDVCIRQLPALNSDFAKKAGKVDTMEEYRTQVHDQLAKRKRTAAVNHARNQILMMLADAAQWARCTRPATSSRPPSARPPSGTPAPGWPCSRSPAPRACSPPTPRWTPSWPSGPRWPKRPWRRSRKRPTCGPSAATRPSAGPPTGSSSTPPSRRSKRKTIL